MSRRFLFAGGGSGGHISPGLAIAERLVEIDPSVELDFACSTRDVDRAMLDDAGVRFHALPAAPVSLRPRGLARFVGGYLRSRTAARQLIDRQRITHVVAMGGFVSAPVVAAAATADVPSTLVNLDDPPGKANRWVARRCGEVLSAVEVSRHPGFATKVIGMPIRRRALAPGPPDACRTTLGLDPAASTLLVTGASQGARSINALVTTLARVRRTVFEGWQVIHLAGETDHAAVAAAWSALGIRAWVQPFTTQMGPVWGAADLAVSRAGASSVAEAWANGVPTLFMPYPWHRDRHQERNAAPLVKIKGAVIETDRVEVDENLAAAGQLLAALMADEAWRRSMREQLVEHPGPDGAAGAAAVLLGAAASAASVVT